MSLRDFFVIIATCFEVTSFSTCLVISGLPPSPPFGIGLRQELSTKGICLCWATCIDAYPILVPAFDWWIAAWSTCSGCRLVKSKLEEKSFIFLLLIKCPFKNLNGWITMKYFKYLINNRWWLYFKYIYWCKYCLKVLYFKSLLNIMW